MTYERRLIDIWKMAKRLRESRSPTMTDRNPDSWLPGFASRIAPDFVSNQYHVSDGGGSTKFVWLADAFTMDEFEGALDQCNNFAPGLDGIKFILFKFLLEDAIRYLLGIFNEIMGMISESWLKTKVVLILKPRKDPELPDSYRPCARKLLEKMLYSRLDYCQYSF
jgi:hypothetical protein